jgi:hypothetical protein
MCFRGAMTGFRLCHIQLWHHARDMLTSKHDEVRVCVPCDNDPNFLLLQVD